MIVFVTGATGWVGGVVVDELLAGGHKVVGLARSEKKATELAAKGARPLLASLDDLGRLAEATAEADATIHLAFNHDFSRFAESSDQEQLVIEAMGEALAGTDKPLLYTSGLALITPGRIVTEFDNPPLFNPAFPRKNELAAAKLAERGVRVGAVRLSPTVHGVGDRLFLAALAGLARATGVSAYVGDGANRWPAVHVSDAGRLYRLALEVGASARAYHACAEEGVTFRVIAEAIGRALDLPVESRSRDHFGALAVFAEADASASSARTRELTGWAPVGPTLLADLADPRYFSV